MDTRKIKMVYKIDKLAIIEEVSNDRKLMVHGRKAIQPIMNSGKSVLRKGTAIGRLTKQKGNNAINATKTFAKGNKIAAGALGVGAVGAIRSSNLSDDNIADELQA